MEKAFFVFDHWGKFFGFFATREEAEEATKVMYKYDHEAEHDHCTYEDYLRLWCEIEEKEMGVLYF